MKSSIINRYLKALKNKDYEMIIKLFSNNDIIISLLYRKIKLSDFYKNPFNDTSDSKIKLLNIFEFDKKDKIKQLIIIYDTANIRNSFVEIKDE